jgi:hypothetical protein
MNFCPKYIHLRNAKHCKDKTIQLIKDPKIGSLEEIRANTPYKVSIKVFACVNVKEQSENYCDTLYDPEAKIKICKSCKIKYVFFYVDESENDKGSSNPAVYLLIFTRDALGEMKKIVYEVKKIAGWLGIAGKDILCYLFKLSGNQHNTMDNGAIKKSFDGNCADNNYKCLPKALGQEKMLFVNEGLKKFTFKPQP